MSVGTAPRRPGGGGRGRGLADEGGGEGCRAPRAGPQLLSPPHRLDRLQCERHLVPGEHPPEISTGSELSAPGPSVSPAGPWRWWPPRGCSPGALTLRPSRGGPPRGTGHQPWRGGPGRQGTSSLTRPPCLPQPGAVVSASLCETCRCEVPGGSDTFRISCETQTCHSRCPAVSARRRPQGTASRQRCPGSGRTRPLPAGLRAPGAERAVLRGVRAGGLCHEHQRQLRPPLLRESRRRGCWGVLRWEAGAADRLGQSTATPRSPGSPRPWGGPCEDSDGGGGGIPGTGPPGSVPARRAPGRGRGDPGKPPAGDGQTDAVPPPLEVPGEITHQLGGPAARRDLVGAWEPLRDPRV